MDKRDTYLADLVANPASNGIDDKVGKGNNEEHQGEEVCFADIDGLESLHCFGEEDGERWVCAT